MGEELLESIALGGADLEEDFAAGVEVVGELVFEALVELKTCLP